MCTLDRPFSETVNPPPPPAIRAISLDLDDTLWPVMPVLVEAELVLERWLGQHAPLTATYLTASIRKAIRQQILAEHPDRAHDMGFVRQESLRRAMQAAGDSQHLAEPAFQVFLAARQQVRLYEDVRPVLAAWSRRYRLVALTNGNADVARIGLGPLFSAAVAAHEAGVAKPDPRIFLEACRRIDVKPSEVLHIGDDPELDVRAARDAGLHAAWVRRPDLFERDDPQQDLAARALAAPAPVFDGLRAVQIWLDGAD